MKFRNYTIYKFCVLSIFAFIKQKTDKLIRDIRDFSFIIDCQQINDNGISFLVKIISEILTFILRLLFPKSSQQITSIHRLSPILLMTASRLP